MRKFAHRSFLRRWQDLVRSDVRSLIMNFYPPNVKARLYKDRQQIFP